VLTVEQIAKLAESAVPIQGAPMLAWDLVDLGPVLRGERVTPVPSCFARDDAVLLLYPGRLNLFMGETESCKTWGALVAVVQELRAGHHVIYVDFEDSPEGVVERIMALGASEDDVSNRFSYIAPSGSFDEVAMEVVEDIIGRRGEPSLVVIDGVTEAMSMIGLDPSKGQDVATFYGGFPRWFARTGAAVILVDHVTKSTENRGRWAIGSERKLSGLDGAAFMFDTISPFGRERTGRVKITVAKDRCGHVRQHEGGARVIALMELRSWPDGGVTVSVETPDAATGGAFRPTFLMERISEVVEANPGLSKRAIRSAVRGKNEVKDLALELLIIEKYVKVELGPNRAQRHVSLLPFSATTEGMDDEDF